MIALASLVGVEFLQSLQELLPETLILDHPLSELAAQRLLHAELGDLGLGPDLVKGLKLLDGQSHHSQGLQELVDAPLVGLDVLTRSSSRLLLLLLSGAILKSSLLSCHSHGIHSVGLGHLLSILARLLLSLKLDLMLLNEPLFLLFKLFLTLGSAELDLL